MLYSILKIEQSIFYGTEECVDGIRSCYLIQRFFESKGRVN